MEGEAEVQRQKLEAEAEVRRQEAEVQRQKLEAEAEVRRQEAEAHRQEAEVQRQKLEAEAEVQRQEAEVQRQKLEAEAEVRRQEAEVQRQKLEAEAEAHRREAEARREKLEAEAEAHRREAEVRREKVEAEAEARRKRLDEEKAEFERLASKRDEERRVRDQKADSELKRAIHRMIGDGDERFGRLMEALTEGDLSPLLRSAGYSVYDHLIRRRGISLAGIPVAEMDLIAYGEHVSVAVEVKTTLRPEYVRHFVDKMGKFREYFPDCSRDEVHGAMAYLTATDSSPKMATRHGLLLIRVVGSSASIVSPPGFEPKNF